MNEKPVQDVDLFRQAVADVTPLPPADRAAHSKKTLIAVLHPPLTTPLPDKLSDPGSGDVAGTEFLRDGLNRMTLRKLRRGEWLIQDELDLHGLNNDDSRRLLNTFMQQAIQRGLRCVSVIHGKGWRSEGRDGILKVHTRHWLTQHEQVLAYCEAPQKAGGSGAVWVLLRNTRLPKE